MKTTSDKTCLGLREPREKPDTTAIRNLVMEAIRDGTAHWQRIQDANTVLLCEHEGRDGTGTKGVDANNRLRGPFPGSSDVDVALAAEVLLEKTDMVRNAVAQGALNSMPVDGGSDAISAGYALIEMHYYLNGPMKRNVDAVWAQAAKWHRGFGAFVIGLDWKRRVHGRERVMRLADVYAWAVDQGTQDFMMAISQGMEGAGAEDMPPEDAQALLGAAEQAGAEAGADVIEAVATRAGLDELAEVLSFYAPDLCEGEAKRAARAFQRGQTEVIVCVYETVEDCPVYRGLRPGVDILMPAETECAATAEWAGMRSGRRNC